MDIKEGGFLVNPETDRNIILSIRLASLKGKHEYLLVLNNLIQSEKDITRRGQLLKIQQQDMQREYQLLPPSAIDTALKSIEYALSLENMTWEDFKENFKANKIKG
jgi:hypothetical protein